MQYTDVETITLDKTFGDEYPVASIAVWEDGSWSADVEWWLDGCLHTVEALEFSSKPSSEQIMAALDERVYGKEK